MSKNAKYLGIKGERNMAKTNRGLVAYAKAQVGGAYWYGTFGQKSSEALYKQKKKQYPQYYNASDFSKQYGRKVHDCIGLVKGYLWCDSAYDDTPKYNSKQDVSANGMLKKCKKKGDIDSIPEVEGVLVFFDGHVGIYIGKGLVIEAKGHAYGVVITALDSRPWTHWGYCPWIEYESEKVTTTKQYFKSCDPKHTSLVDALKSIGEYSGFSHRMRIASVNDVKNYVGTAKQNVKLLNLLKQGKLIKP
jgi:hypothetical protein